MEPRLSSFDLGIEGFGQQPEAVGVLQVTALERGCDASEVMGRWGRHFGVGCQSQKVTE
jgi:hypothetical protein